MRYRLRVVWLSLRAHVIALFWALVVEAGLKLRPLPALASKLGTPLDRTEPDRPVPPEAQSDYFTAKEWIRIQATDRVLGVWPFGDTCLRRSLVWGHTLRSRSPRLRLGVARTAAGGIGAHSWLEFGDVSLGLDPDVAYAPLGSATE